MTPDQGASFEEELARLCAEDPVPSRDIVEAVYAQLRAMAGKRMRGERQGHTLQTTALANEVYLRLARQDTTLWQSQEHFYCVAAGMMRRVLIDHARAWSAQKRGGPRSPVELNEALYFAPELSPMLVALDDALEVLTKSEPRVGKVIELRFFAGLSVLETAAALKCSDRTVKRDWEYGRAWLKKELSEPLSNDSRSAGAL